MNVFSTGEEFIGVGVDIGKGVKALGLQVGIGECRSSTEDGDVCGCWCEVCEEERSETE